MSQEVEQRRLLNRVRSWFDDPAQRRHYEAEALRGLTPPEHWLLQALRAGRVLDVGCGAGRVALELSRRGLAVTGCDVSAELLRSAATVARAQRQGITFVRVEPFVLPFRSAVFDAVVACKVYGYLPGRATRLAYLDEVRRVLRPGGKLYLTQHIVPAEAIGQAHDEHFNDAARDFAHLESGDTFPAGRGYVHWFTARDLYDELSATELTVEVFEDDCIAGGDGLLGCCILRRDLA